MIEPTALDSIAASNSAREYPGTFVSDWAETVQEMVGGSFKPFRRSVMIPHPGDGTGVFLPTRVALSAWALGPAKPGWDRRDIWFFLSGLIVEINGSGPRGGLNVSAHGLHCGSVAEPDGKGVFSRYAPIQTSQGQGIQNVDITVERDRSREITAHRVLEPMMVAVSLVGIRRVESGNQKRKRTGGW